MPHTYAKDRVVRMARMLFAQSGSCVSMRDIAKELDIRAPSLYSHFPSKNAMLETCIADYTDAIAQWSMAPWDNAYAAALGYQGIAANFPQELTIVHQDPSNRTLVVVQHIEAAIHDTFARNGVPLALIPSLAAFIRAPYLRSAPLTNEDTGKLRDALLDVVTTLAPMVAA